MADDEPMEDRVGPPVDDGDGPPPEEVQEPPKKKRGFFKALVVRSFLALVVLVGLVLLSVLLLLRSESFARFVLDRAMPIVDDALPGTISFASFSGGLGHDFALQGVSIADETGDVFITADSLALEWDVFDLIFKDVTAHKVELHKPVFILKQRDGLPLNVVGAFVKPKPPDYEPPPKEGPSKGVPIDIEVKEVLLHDGTFVFEKADGRRIVDVQDIDLAASYSLRGFEHDAALRSVGAKLDAPIEIPRTTVAGGARMYTDELVLDLDGVTIGFKDDVVKVSGSLGSVKSLDFDLDLFIERFDLLDIQEFAAKAPLRGLVSGPLAVTGPLSDLHMAGELTTAEGGKLAIADGGVRIKQPLEHHADITMTAFDLGEILDVPQLPPALTGRVTWDGGGTGLDTLHGAATAKLEPVRYQRMLLGPVSLDASLAEAKVTVKPLKVGLAGGTPRLDGVIDLKEGCFDVRLGGGVGNLARLRERIVAPFTSGSVDLNTTAKGCWATESDVVALRTDGSARFGGLALGAANTKVGDGTLTWGLDLAIPRAASGPLLSGPITLTASGVEAAKQVVDTVDLTGALDGSRFTIQDLQAGSGPDLGLGLGGWVDWGDSPTLAIHGDAMWLRYRSVRLASNEPFDFRIREGAFEASGLVADTDEGGRVIVQGHLDPKGDTNALLRILTFDLVQTDAFLPENGKLRGTLDDLTVKLTGEAKAPAISVRTRLRQFATRGRGPIDLDLDLALADGVLTGSASLDELLTLDVGRFPLAFRLDGKGGLPFWIPEDEALDVDLTLLEGALARFEAPLGARLPANYVGGKVRGKVELDGTSSNPQAGGAFLLRDLMVDLTKMETSSGGEVEEAETSREVTVQASYGLEDGVVTLKDTRLRTNAEGTVLEARARAQVPIGDFLMAVAGPRGRRTKERPRMLDGLEVTASLRRLPMTLLHLLSPATAPVSGALEGELSLLGEIAKPEVRADLALLGGRVGQRALRRLELKAAVANDRLDAALDLVPELLVEDVASASGGGGGSGGKNGKKGKAQAGKGQAGKGQGGKAQKPKSKKRAEEEARNEALRALLAKNPDAGALTVKAQAPLPLRLDGSIPFKEQLSRRGLRGEVRADAFPLAVGMAFVPGSMESKGDLVLNGTIGGTLMNPKPDIHLTLEDGSFKYQKTSVSYEDIDLDVSLTAEGIAVNAALDTLPLIRNPLDLVFKPNVSKDTRVQGKRSATLSGTIALDGWRLGAFDLSLEARRLWGIYTQEIKAQLGAGLTATGVWPDIQVNGLVDIDEVNVDMGQETFGHKVAPMTLPENLRVHRAEDAKKKDRVAAFAPVVRDDGTSILDNLDANVLVRLGNKVRVKLAMGIAQGREDALRALNMIGSIEPEVNVGGEVRIELHNGTPSFVGGIEVTRDSQLTALTKKFQIRPGSEVTMVGELLDSRLDVVADHASNYGSIQVAVRGNLRGPEIEFSSEEFADQGDIMAVLLTGKPLSEQTSQEGGSIWSTISSALAGFGTKIAGKYTPLDKLDIDLGDDLSTGSVEAGKAITPELFLLSRFRWGVEDERENRVEAEVQFRPRGVKRFSIEASIGDRLAGGAQLVWRVLY